MLATLPKDLQARLPVFLTHRAGVTQEVADLLDIGAMAGHSFSSVASLLAQLHARTDMRLQQEYHAACGRWEGLQQARTTPGAQPTLLAFTTTTQQQAPWPGKLFKTLPGVDYLQKVYLRLPEGQHRRRLFTALMASTKAKVLKIDACHKVAKLVSAFCLCIWGVAHLYGHWLQLADSPCSTKPRRST